MTASATVASVRLPRGVDALLASYARLQPEAELRAWVGREGAWMQVFPPGAADGVGAPRELRRTLPLDEGMQLALEATDAAEGLDFLAAALGQALAAENEARSAARELSEKYEEINLLYSISEILGSVLTLQTAAARILGEVADVLGARRASLWVYDPVAEVLLPTASVGDDAGPRPPIAISDPDSATARVFRDCQPLSLERGASLPRDRNLEPRPHGREAFLSVPVTYTPPEGTTRTVGVITLVGRRTNVRFTAGDARLLAAIASQVGAALETQRLVQESLRQERLERELELAHDLQLKLLPDTSAFQGVAEVAARVAPAESVGGDFYHLFRLSGGRIGVIIGDVSSHGFSAALIMALTMSAVGIYGQEAGPPREVLRRIHAALANELETTEMYLSLFYGVLDPAAGRLTFSNAGHPHAFAVRGDGAAVRLGATSPPLGIVALDGYGEDSVGWESGRDLLCLFTDGLSDALAGGSESGETLVVDEVVALRDRPLPEILDHIFALTNGAEAELPADDRTALLVRV